MSLKTVEISNWLPDTGYQGMLSIQGLAPTEFGYSGIGEVYRIVEAPSPLVGTPQALLRSAYPVGEQLFIGTTGSGTNSRIYGLSAYPGGTWTDRFAAGTANADWHFLQFGSNTLAAGGTGTRLKVATVAVPNFTNVTSNISPKFICRFGNRVFAANLSWNIAGITTVATTGTETDYIFASNYNDVGVFGDSASSPGLGATIFPLRDEFGDITGMAATETYILVCKERALIIGRRSTAYDIDWSYLGARFGCVHPRSIVVDGEDIYLWSNSGPIRIVAGDEIEQIGNGRISWTMQQPASIDGYPTISAAIVNLGFGSGVDGAMPIYANQDTVSGVITWLCSPGTGPDWTASGYLDRMIFYDPNTRKLSWADCTNWNSLGDAVLKPLKYKATASSRNQIAEGYRTSPISNSLYLRENGDCWGHYSDQGATSASQVLSVDPYFGTHFFAGDDGGNFRVDGVYHQFQDFSEFGRIAVTIAGVSDRGSGVIDDGGTYTGVDPQGRTDTCGSPSFQCVKMRVTLGNVLASVHNAAQRVRNVRLVEVEIMPTVKMAGGARGR